MANITFNTTPAQGELLLKAFAERYPGYGKPEYDGDLPKGMPPVQQGKLVIREVMRDYLRNFKIRLMQAEADSSDTELV